MQDQLGHQRCRLVRGVDFGVTTSEAHVHVDIAKLVELLGVSITVKATEADHRNLLVNIQLCQIPLTRSFEALWAVDRVESAGRSNSRLDDLDHLS